MFLNNLTKKADKYLLTASESPTDNVLMKSISDVFTHVRTLNDSLDKIDLKNILNSSADKGHTRCDIYCINIHATKNLRYGLVNSHSPYKFDWIQHRHLFANYMNLVLARKIPGIRVKSRIESIHLETYCGKCKAFRHTVYLEYGKQPKIKYCDACYEDVEMIVFYIDW